MEIILKKIRKIRSLNRKTVHFKQGDIISEEAAQYL
jgi:hypothetical protein